MAWVPTPEQAAIIDHDAKRSARILAGPGTGKSATVIRFMIRAFEEAGLQGKLLTFTRAATIELRDKVAEHSEALGRPSTVHSFSIATVLANPDVSGLPEPIRIADDWESKRLIREHLKVLMGCHVKVVDRAINEMASAWMSLDAEVDPDLPDAIRDRFAGVWDQHRRIFGYSLLAELPFRLLRAMEDHPDLALGDWDYLVVDEYQDLNKCDLSVLRYINDRGRAIVAAGDDDQSIYSFRRAHPVGIQQFLTDYPEAADLGMSVSQRCSTQVLDWARHVIGGLPGRPPRPALTPAPHCLPGEARYLRFDSWTKEVDGVARLINVLITQRGVAPEDIAVLFRTNYRNAWSQPLADRLADLEVPVVNTTEVAEMFSERSNRRLVAIARLAVNELDSLAWWTLLELEPSLGPAVRNHFYERAIENHQRFAAQLLADRSVGYPSLAPAARARVSDLVERTLGIVMGIDVAAAEIDNRGWGAWLASKAGQMGGCEERFAELLIELDDHLEASEGLQRFMSQAQPVGTDLRSGRSAGSVRLMTMASSKGLTVRAAFVVGAEEGVIPLEGADPDEERRLLYVAMTRSTEFLFLTWSGSRTGPTARTGVPRVARGRNRSPLLTYGPVNSEDGAAYVMHRAG